MEELDVRKQMAMKVMDVEYFPSIQEEILEDNSFHKLSLLNISALGIAFEPLVSAVQTVVGGGSGMSGIYHVYTKGLPMAKFRDAPGFLGSLLTNTGSVGGGQAVITPLALDPTMLCVAAAIMIIEKKFDDIQELQREILDFLKTKEKAKLRGNINTLSDVLNNYKFNWNNEKYKTNKHILVQDIRKDSEQSILLYRDQIKKKLAKQGSIHSDQEVKAKLQKLQSEFKDYQLALYLYSFSSFLEVMLLENFDSQYLESVSNKIEEYSFQYRELYTSCYNQIEAFSKSSVQSILLNGISGLSKGAGEIVAKIPVVSKGQLDEGLITAGGKLGKFNSQRPEKALLSFVDSSISCAAPFLDSIRMVNKIYNQPIEVLFDAESIYFVSIEALAGLLSINKQKRENSLRT
ncbi:MAG: hypothetical protein PHQ83_05840 [Eubacteriales bacterium]|nr:hypothetical protein [Eubacteriales bacterium]